MYYDAEMFVLYTTITLENIITHLSEENSISLLFFSLSPLTPESKAQPCQP